MFTIERVDELTFAAWRVRKEAVSDKGEDWWCQNLHHIMIGETWVT